MRIQKDRFSKNRLFYALAPALLSLLLVGCGDEDDDSDAEDETTPTLTDAEKMGGNQGGATSTTPPTGKGDIVLNSYAYNFDDGDAIADNDLTSLALSITSVVVSADGDNWTTIWDKLEGEALDVIAGTGTITIKGVPVGTYPHVFVEFGDEMSFQRQGASCTAQENITYYGTNLLFSTATEAAELTYSFESPWFGTYSDNLDDYIPNTSLSRSDYLWYLQSPVVVTEAGTTNLYLGFETGASVSGSSCTYSTISYSDLALGTTATVGGALNAVRTLENELTGSFVTDCVSDGDGGYTRTFLTYGDSGAFYKTYSTYSDSACSTQTWYAYDYYYYRIGSESSVVSGATDIDLKFSFSSLYLADATIAGTFNTNSICGKTDWAEGFNSTTTGVADGAASCPVENLTSGSIYYRLYALDGSSLQLGAEEAGRGGTAALRLQSIDTSLTYTKQ